MSNNYLTAVKYIQMPNVLKQVLKEIADFADDNVWTFPSIQIKTYFLTFCTNMVFDLDIFGKEI